MMKPIEWKDITSFSQGDKERVPRTFEARVDAIRLVVTRRHGLNGWFMVCEPWHALLPLGDITADEAKKAAGRNLRANALALMAALGIEETAA